MGLLNLKHLLNVAVILITFFSMWPNICLELRGIFGVFLPNYFL